MEGKTLREVSVAGGGSGSGSGGDARRLRARVERLFRKGVRDFGLIAPGDAVLVGLSGGKDSLALLELLGGLRRHRNGCFRLEAVHVRMANVGYRTDTDYLAAKAREQGVELHVREGSFEPDRNDRRSPCFLCSWTRRKILFDTARELHCGKVALGHHQDDILCTALMNLLFAGSFATMPARLRMRKFPLTIVRPLCLVAEADLRAWAAGSGFEPVKEACPYERASQRAEAARLLAAMEQKAPEARHSLWHALVKEGKLVEE